MTNLKSPPAAVSPETSALVAQQPGPNSAPDASVSGAAPAGIEGQSVAIPEGPAVATSRPGTDVRVTP
jgi:hypothetical protein